MPLAALTFSLSFLLPPDKLDLVMWNWWRTVQTAAGIKQSYTKIISSPKAVYNIGYLGDKDIFNFEGLIYRKYDTFIDRSDSIKPSHPFKDYVRSQCYVFIEKMKSLLPLFALTLIGGCDLALGFYPRFISIIWPKTDKNTETMTKKQVATPLQTITKVRKRKEKIYLTYLNMPRVFSGLWGGRPLGRAASGAGGLWGGRPPHD